MSNALEIYALDLINRQKAEIERLQDECIKSLAAAFKIAEAEARVEAYILSKKAEAVKEFAERLKAGLIEGGIYPVLVKNTINKVLKEMTEEKTDEKIH